MNWLSRAIGRLGKPWRLARMTAVASLEQPCPRVTVGGRYGSVEPPQTCSFSMPFARTEGLQLRMFQQVAKRVPPFFIGPLDRRGDLVGAPQKRCLFHLARMPF